MSMHTTTKVFGFSSTDLNNVIFFELFETINSNGSLKIFDLNQSFIELL